MKIPHSSRDQGSVLLLVLFTCASIGIVLASFLALTSSRNKLAMRSMGWNQCVPVMEAGIEEALTHLHEDTIPTANGWTATSVGGQPVIVKKRTLPDGSYFNVTIYNPNSTSPAIYSQGFVPSPLQADKYISRLVRVGATNPVSVFTRAIATSGPITLSGNNVFVDGWDPKLGPYNIVSNRNASGAIATSSGAPGAINIGNAHVFGKVETGAGGTITYNGGAAGDIPWNTSGKKGIEPGWSNNTMNVSYPANTLPAAVANSPLIPVASTGLTLSDQTNRVAGFASSSSQKPMIVNGNATLFVDGDFKISGTGYILINPGGSLTVYVNGSTSVTGGGIVYGTTGSTTNFTYIGLPTNTTADFGGGSDFYGTINAPQADVKLSGGGQFYGALIANTFNAVGMSAFHYDNSLAKKGDLTVMTWTEL